jgi:hypothetical protein
VAGASSTYAGQTKVAGRGEDVSPRWVATTYGPQALFDGLPQNAWVEGVDGPGIGQYVEFELKEYALGASVYNGLKMRLDPTVDVPPGWDRYFESGVSATADRLASIWGKNNRVKVLAFSAGGAPPVALDLADDWGPQHFDVVLAPGKYRATITSVYKGSAWDDTCLGELCFDVLGAAETLRKESPELWTAFVNDMKRTRK